jgi:hypothetical protein
MTRADRASNGVAAILTGAFDEDGQRGLFQGKQAAI